MQSPSPETRRLTWIAGIGVTICHFLLILFVSPHAPVVWFELPLLAVVAWLTLRRRVAPELTLSFCTVCLFLLAEPATGIGFAIWWVPFVLLFLIEAEPRPRVLAGWGLWTGLLAATGIYAWIWTALVTFFQSSAPVMLPLFLLFTFLIGVQLAIFLPLARILHDRLRWPLAVVAPGLYTVIEFWMPLPVPIALYMGLSRFPFWLQPADVLGVAGVSFLIAVVGAALFFVVQSIRDRKPRGILAGAAVALLVLSLQFGYGLWSYHRYRDDPASPSIDVAMIQPLSPLRVMNKDRNTQQRVAAKLERLSLDAVNARLGRPDLLIWPEGAAAFASRTPQFNPPYMNAVRDIQQATSVTMLVQNIAFTRLPGSERLRYYSTISLIQPVGRVVEDYYKNILMPFGEYLPLEKQFPILKKWLPEARSILPGTEAMPIHGPGGPFAPLICYEVLFPGYVRRLVGLNCTYIVNLTDDGWYDPRQEPIQHEGLAVCRAIENRKPLIRSTNSGISSLIDARGVIAPGRQARPQVRTWLRGRVYPRTGRTVYNRFGNILHPWILTPLYLLLLVYVYIPGRRRPTLSPEGEARGLSPRPGPKNPHSRATKEGKTGSI